LAVTLTTLRYVRAEDGKQRVELDLAEFQALVDAASIAEHGLPDVQALISELKVALASPEEYVGADELLAEYDAAHRTS
jgi:hypothetical protein